jgi:FkbM family methyltransferase
LKTAIKNFVRKTLRRFDLDIIRYAYRQQLEAQLKELEKDVDSFFKVPEYTATQVLRFAEKSQSQYKQDLFVLSETDFKKAGFFVEFGATNGVGFSNTHLLEKEFEWEGILAEPARCWHEDLKGNRSCFVDTNCVWSESGKRLAFNEVDGAWLSTVDAYSSADLYHQVRKRGKKYDVTTISLEDLLDKYGAPRNIDYLSIDTEGSEYEILRNFPFEKYQFKVITCEHNYTQMRDKILSLLTSKGYKRKYLGLSKFDDWYVRTT